MTDASTDRDRVQVTSSNGVGTILLARPEKLNACTPAMHRAVQAAVARMEDDDDVRVVVFRGAGRAFCAGSDLNETGRMEGKAAQDYIRLDFGTKARIASCAKPVIAALQGHVAGGGFELALACDMRLVAEDVQFSLPEITLGTIPGAGGLQRLPQVVGLGIAKEWAMTGRRIGAEEAYRRGLANAIHPVEALVEATTAFAEELAARSSTALALCKVALDPAPPATDGLVGVYHRLASQACHDDPVYQQRARGFGRKEAT